MKTKDKQEKLGIIGKILNTKAKYGFTPSKAFYEKVGINRKRWPMISKGQICPTLDELKSVCLYFEVDIKDYL